MTINTRIAAVSAGLIALAAAATAVAAPPWNGSYDRIPDGSYQQSCRDISAFNGTLYARCQSSSGLQYESQIAYRSCPRGIANINGRLQCEGWNGGSGGGGGGGWSGGGGGWSGGSGGGGGGGGWSGGPGGSGGGWGGGGSGPVGLIVYENPDYKGMRLEISESVPDLAGSGLDDQITSVRVMRGSWLLCSARDFNGDCQTVSADSPNLKTINLNDRVTSIRRLRP